MHISITISDKIHSLSIYWLSFATLCAARGRQGEAKFALSASLQHKDMDEGAEANSKGDNLLKKRGRRPYKSSELAVEGVEILENGIDDGGEAKEA